MTRLCIYFLVGEWDACEGEELMRSQQLAVQNALVWPCEVTQQSSITWHLTADLVYHSTPHVAALEKCSPGPVENKLILRRKKCSVLCGGMGALAGH